MSDGVGLTADEVVESVRAVGVHEAVADPLARLDDLADVGLELKGLLDAFVVDLAAVVEVGLVRVAVKAEDVERVLARDRDEVTGAGPVDLCA